MQKYNLHELIEYNDSRFNPKVLVNEPGYRMVLLNLRKGQAVPEHANQAVVTVYAITGHITFYENGEPIDLRAGEVVRIAAGAQHHLEAHEDSALYVLAAGQNAPQAATSASQAEELDLREVPRPLRHSLVFQRLDALPTGGSFIVVNDHDPVPLSMQIDSMRPGQAVWEYIKRGPDIFRIRIRRIAPAAAPEASVPAQPQAAGKMSTT
ncbi:MAG TPA: DUF2249 domain-containing protein [Edaphobacter sp.]|jgi:uncharacterized protein (DUF2249 family)/quercetin dioxygenase-like cupin family protein|nr:DUF2249 domain-containing protein [Edaphobacter sp.]